MHAQIVLFDGFDPLDVVAPFEVLVAGSDAVAANSRSNWCPRRGRARWSAAPAA
jgi:putative intracellular protease/amidase